MTGDRLPTGTVTFLFTDIEGSTRLLEHDRPAYRAALARHHALLRDAVAASGGIVFETLGDAVYAAYAQPSQAVAGALRAQRAMRGESWDATGPIRVRIALHTGEVVLVPGEPAMPVAASPAAQEAGAQEQSLQGPAPQGTAIGATASSRPHYFGAALTRCARLMAIAHGGQTLLSQATADLVGDDLTDGAGLRDMGEHRLKDLARPEHVYQLIHPDLPADFPALRSLDAAPHNLPLQLTSFVGREQELAAVTGLLDAHRLVTLTGAGGTGKTRLALQVAADVLPAYPDGAWLVELAAVRDPALVPQALASAVGVREEPDQPLIAALTHALARRRLLLVLDNCEHLLDACAGLADALLRACPHLTILATSRQALGIAGETTWRVPSLALPDIALLEAPSPQRLPAVAAVTRYEAVRLFADRAQAVQPHFALTSGNVAAVVQICALLDGIPLAIELAAARVRVLPPEQLLLRLEDRFHLLTGGSRTALERHQTLQAAVDWGYTLLTDQEKTLFARLSVFAGGWTLEAAEAICPDGQDSGGPPDGGQPQTGGPEPTGRGSLAGRVECAGVLDLLTRLVDKSLVVVEEEPDGTARYRLLETLRQYGQRQLAASGDAGAAQRAHATYYVTLLASAPLGSPEQQMWLRRLEREHANLRVGLDWWEAHGDVPLLLRALTQWQHWSFNGHLAEGRTRLARALAAPGCQEPTHTRAHALHAAAGMAMWQGDYTAARALAEERLALACTLGAGIEYAQYLLAGIELESGDIAAARRRLETHRQEVVAVRLESQWLVMLGNVLRLQGDLPAARAHLEEALAIFRARAGARPTIGVAHALDWLAVTAYEQGDLGTARANWREALIIRRALGDRAESMDSLEGLAAVAVTERRPRRALQLAGAAAAVRRAAGIQRRGPEGARLEQWLAPARQALAADEAAAAWAEGQAMTLEQAIAYALDEVSSEAATLPALRA